MDALPVPGTTGSAPCARRPRGADPLLARLRGLVGQQVEVRTAGERLEGTLLSCTPRSAWVVAGDVDHVVELPLLLDVRGPLTA